MKIKKGDTVKIIAGKDKGKTGRVIRVLAERNRYEVEGVAQYKRHLKPGRSQSNPDGGIIEMTGSIHASNVMIVDPASNVPTRIGYKFEGDKKVRVGRGKSKGALLDAK
jgi:large subunit ribosomal protein L24